VNDASILASPAKIAMSAGHHQRGKAAAAGWIPASAGVAVGAWM